MRSVFKNGRSGGGNDHAAIGLLTRFHQSDEKPGQRRAAAVEDVREFVFARSRF